MGGVAHLQLVHPLSFQYGLAAHVDILHEFLVFKDALYFGKHVFQIVSVTEQVPLVLKQVSVLGLGHLSNL